MEKTELLLKLAESGAAFRELSTSTTELAKALGNSQQTISRNLLLLEEHGLLQRKPTTRGIGIRISEKGILELKAMYLLLEKVFGKGGLSLSGSVTSGLMEGKYYMSLKGYESQFKEKLGFSPFPGTLNVKVNCDELSKFLGPKEKAEISGFVKGNRAFGTIAAYNAKIRNIRIAIIVPERTSHPKDIMEIISEFNLRKKLKLKDKSVVKIEG